MPVITAPEATQAISSFAQLRERARPKRPLRLAVVVADDEVALSAADAAMRLGIAHPVLIGEEARIRAKLQSLSLADLARSADFVNTQQPAATAVQLARE